MKTTELFDEWTTYEQVVTNDYMHQREFFAALGRELSIRLHAPLSVVDLGCGVRAPFVTSLNCFEVIHYVGIDQSESVLARAEAVAAYRRLGEAAGIEQLRSLARMQKLRSGGFVSESSRGLKKLFLGQCPILPVDEQRKWLC